MKKLNIAILGAGIGGLCSAIAFNRKSFKVTLFERYSKPQNIGAGLVLWPNANLILDKFNLLDDIKAAGYSLNKMQRVTESGEFLNEIDLSQLNPKSGYNNFAITRKDLQDILINKLVKNNITIQFNHRVITIDTQSKNNAVVHFENGKQMNADIIIGADGRMNSIARYYVTGNNKPIYQGYVNWVGLIDKNSGIKFNKTIFDYWGCGERFGIVPLSGNSAYWAGCKAMQQGLGEPAIGNKNTLLSLFKNWPGDIKSIIEQSAETEIKRIEVFDHDPIPHWHRNNVCLIGDAAHAPLPTSGQGACQAIEDGYYLAKCLEEIDFNSITNIQLAFEQFHEIRSEITSSIVQNARHFTRSLFNTDPKFCEARNEKAKLQ